MLVVREQDRVDAPDGIGGNGGPVTLVHPKPGSGAARYVPPGGSNAGSTRRRSAPTSMMAVAAPIAV